MDDPVTVVESPRFWAHRSSEQLEMYALDRLTESEIEETEEHLLICEPCRVELEEVAGLAFALRGALQGNPPAPSGKVSGWFRRQVLDRRQSAFSVWPRLAFAGPLASVVLASVVLASVLIVGLHRSPGGSKGPDSGVPALASLELSAMRGDVPAVRATRELRLTLLETAGESNLKVEIVTDSGSWVWSGPPLRPNTPGSCQVKVPGPLEPGAYLVRLYRTAGNLIHEYGFRIAE